MKRILRRERVWYQMKGRLNSHLKNYAVFWGIIFLTFLLEATVLEALRVFGVKPQITLAIVVIINLIFDSKRAFFLSIFAGLLKDIFAVNSFGINLSLYALFSFLIGRLTKKISFEHRLSILGLIFSVVVINAIFLRFIFYLSGCVVYLGIFLRIMALEGIYTLACLSVLFRFFKLKNF
ncbi:MAG: hypothetical protein NC928_02295 [Candidatus Omnitrophica bacterium]|nr:hypothetical protein [Candidatus Omnitrophota bacterium]